MSDNAKPADIPVLTFAECLERLYGFKHKRLKSGGILLESVDGSTKVIFPSVQKTLHHGEIREFLEAFDFEPADIEKARIDIIRYDAGLEVPTEYPDEGLLASTKKTLETLNTLSKMSYPRRKQSEETLKWMDDLFRKLDSEREEYKNLKNS